MTTVKSPTFLVAAIGSYPFAGFIKEEALQTLSIPIMNAISAGDLETAKAQTREIDAMIADQWNLTDIIPFKALVKQLLAFLWKEKIWWLIPLILILLLFALLIIFGQSSAVAPFIYMLF